jgi:hypothetical protein
MENQRDKNGRFIKGNKRPKKWTEIQIQKTSGPQHYSWKGEKASYRALHYWLRRQLGKPTRCSCCGKSDSRPRFIQWANIDGKYRRAPEDYVAMCGSCHKFHDLAIAKKDVPKSNQ